MNRVALVAPSVAAAVLFGCGGSGGGDAPHDGAYSEAASRIINGTLDYTHQAVVATFGSYSGCTGTIIHVSGGDLYVLTAGHCVAQDPPQWVVQGDNYDYPTQVYAVAEYQDHPSYSGEEYDFAMLRATGASGSTPVIPAMSMAEDDLEVGTEIRHVGYGLISWPNGSTSERHETINTIAQFYSSGSEFLYEQPTSGPCSGDSGGPGLTVGTEMVAGVVSRGDEGCSSIGVSGRVSRAYDSLIVPFIGVDPVQTCGHCSQSAVMAQGACVDVYNTCLGITACQALALCVADCDDAACVQHCLDYNPAGLEAYGQVQSCICDTACPSLCATDPLCTGVGGGGTGGSGTGGSGTAGTAPGDQWVAGDAQDLGYEGDVQGSCALSPPRPTEGQPLRWLLAAGALAAAGARRRRRGWALAAAPSGLARHRSSRITR